MKFTECISCLEKHISVKNIYKGAKHGFATLSRKTVHEVEADELPSKKKVWGVAVNKYNADCLLGHEMTRHYSFLLKRFNCKRLPIAKN